MLQKSYHTKTADLISQFIQKNREHGFNAASLYEFLKENGLDVNKTTVYRNLDKLTESGKLVRLKSPVSDGYVYRQSDEDGHCDTHIHFHCNKCGSVIHLSDDATSEYLKSISEALGLSIDLSTSSLNGLCQKCRKKTKKQ
ncbi:MAG: transcriptional repressor [Treponema sp.]|nr:transcriptional repressor [Treponema sp.]MBQ5382835.1 transcriptional repressor [Treponema sp.]